MANEWNDSELDAAVRAYAFMLEQEKASTRYSKREQYRQLAADYGRTEKAYEYRMQNISHVLQLMGREWISGLRPAANVGTSVLPRLIKLIRNAKTKESRPAFSMSPKREFLRGPDGNFLWPFPDGTEPEDIDWTEDVDREWRRQAGILSGGEHVPAPPQGVAKPKEVSSFRKEYVRDAAVISWVRSRAMGRCECCGEKAPFLDSKGDDFLEVHHLRQLANGGSDRVSNAIAVCPNCHRRLHHGADRDLKRADIYRRIQEVIPE